MIYLVLRTQAGALEGFSLYKSDKKCRKIGVMSRHGETCLLVHDSAVLFPSTSCCPLNQTQRRTFIFGTGKQKGIFSLQDYCKSLCYLFIQIHMHTMRLPHGQWFLRLCHFPYCRGFNWILDHRHTVQNIIISSSLELYNQLHIFEHWILLNINILLYVQVSSVLKTEFCSAFLFGSVFGSLVLFLFLSSVLFGSVVTLQYVLNCSVPFWFIQFNSFLFSFLFVSIIWICSILFCSILLYFVIFCLFGSILISLQNQRSGVSFMY